MYVFPYLKIKTAFYDSNHTICKWSGFENMHTAMEDFAVDIGWEKDNLQEVSKHHCPNSRQ